MATNGMFAYEKIILKQSDLSTFTIKIKPFQNRSVTFTKSVKYRVTSLPPANEGCEGYVFTGVCLSTRGGSWSLSRVVSIGGGVLCPGVLCWAGGLCPEGSLLGAGVCVQGVLCLRGVCVQGVSVRESPHPHTVTSGQYASYWNAFLFRIFLCNLS